VEGSSSRCLQSLLSYSFFSSNRTHTLAIDGPNNDWWILRCGVSFSGTKVGRNFHCHQTAAQPGRISRASACVARGNVWTQGCSCFILTCTRRTDGLLHVRFSAWVSEQQSATPQEEVWARQRWLTRSNSRLGRYVLTVLEWWLHVGI